MANRVRKVAELIGDEIVIIQPRTDFPAILTNMEPAGRADGPSWHLTMEIGEGSEVRRIQIDLAPFLTLADLETARSTPVAFGAQVNKGFPTRQCLFFREGFYLPERPLATSRAIEEAILRAKKLAYEEEGELSVLKSQVSNFEAAAEFARKGSRREQITDDVKRLVWARDGGACIKCNSQSNLQFDHIIAVAMGGSNHANNIQLLCKPCNLRKSANLTF